MEEEVVEEAVVQEVKERQEEGREGKKRVT